MYGVSSLILRFVSLRANYFNTSITKWISVKFKKHILLRYDVGGICSDARPISQEEYDFKRADALSRM
jgi:hypothetical protein